MLRAIFFATLGCAAASPRADGAPTTPGSAAVDATMTCNGAGGAQWTAKLVRTAIDECVYREKDSILDLRVGTLEEGVVVHLVDFKGTGRYSIAGASGSKVSLVAPGGVGEATTTNVDSTSDDPCRGGRKCKRLSGYKQVVIMVDYAHFAPDFSIRRLCWRPPRDLIA